MLQIFYKSILALFDRLGTPAKNKGLNKKVNMHLYTH